MDEVTAPAPAVNADDAALLRALLTLFVAASGGKSATMDQLGRVIGLVQTFARHRGISDTDARNTAFALHLKTSDTRLPRRPTFATLTVSERTGLANALTGVLAARMRRTRFTTAMLAEATQMYTLLGCAPEATASLLHSAQTDDADQWAFVSFGSARAAVVEVETGSGKRQQKTETVATAVPGPPPVVALDAAKIEAKIAESAQISALLHSIFTGDEDSDARPTDPAPVEALPENTSAESAATGDAAASGPLTPAQTAYLAQIVTRSEWSASEADALARSLGLLPLAAREAINDAAFEIAEEALIEGDDLLTLNPYALDLWKEAYGLPT